MYYFQGNWLLFNKRKIYCRDLQTDCSLYNFDIPQWTKVVLVLVHWPVLISYNFKYIPFSLNSLSLNALSMYDYFGVISLKENHWISGCDLDIQNYSFFQLKASRQKWKELIRLCFVRFKDNRRGNLAKIYPSLWNVFHIQMIFQSCNVVAIEDYEKSNNIIWIYFTNEESIFYK